MSVFTLLNLITWLYLGANNLNFRQIESSFTVNSKVDSTHRGQNFGVFFTLFIQKKRCFNFAVPGGLIIFDSQRLSITCNWLVSHTIVCVTSKTTSLKILREMHTYIIWYNLKMTGLKSDPFWIASGDKPTEICVSKLIFVFNCSCGNRMKAIN